MKKYLSLAFLILLAACGEAPKKGSTTDANADLNAKQVPFFYTGTIAGYNIAIDSNDIPDIRFFKEIWQPSQFFVGDTNCLAQALTDIDSTTNNIRIIYKPLEGNEPVFSDCSVFYGRALTLTLSNASVQEFIDPQSDTNSYLAEIIQTANMNGYEIDNNDIKSTNLWIQFEKNWDFATTTTSKREGTLIIVYLNFYKWSIATSEGGYREAMIYQDIAKSTFKKVPTDKLSFGNPFPDNYFSGGKFSQYLKDRDKLIEEMFH